MAGDGMVLTERDRAIVRDVAELKLVSRPQLQRLGHFGSRTRANAVLARLVRCGYLAVRRQPVVGGSRRLLYYLGRRGEELLDLEGDTRRVGRLSDLFIEHHLRATDVKLTFARTRDAEYVFDRWLTEPVLRAARLGVVPDGYVEYRHTGLLYGGFIEVDLGTETLNRWERKATAYLQLAQSGAFRSITGLHYFRVLVIVLSTGRVETLRRTVTKVTSKIFWLPTLAELTAEGPLGAIWRRPGTDRSLHSLTKPQ